MSSGQDVTAPHSSTYPSTVHPPPTQPPVTLSVHMPTPLKPTQDSLCFSSQPIHTRWVCQPAAEPHPLGGRCAWWAGEDPGVLGPGAGRGGPSPPLASPPHTHMAGGPDGACPPSSQEPLLAAQPQQLGEECAPSVRQPRGKQGTSGSRLRPAESREGFHSSR